MSRCGNTRWTMRLGMLHAPCNRRDDRDLVAILQGGGLLFQEANILLVHVDIHEPAELALLITEPALEARILLIETRQDLLDRCAVGGHLRLVAGHPLQWRGDADHDGHA